MSDFMLEMNIGLMHMFVFYSHV